MALQATFRVNLSAHREAQPCAGLARWASNGLVMFVRQKSRSAPPRRGTARKRSKSVTRRKPAPRRRSMARARLEQRHLDVAGLTLIAAGIYLAMVLWLGWDGGRVGSAANQGLSFVFGKVAYLIPVALLASGAALILKPFLPAIKPLRTGRDLPAGGAAARLRRPDRRARPRPPAASGELRLELVPASRRDRRRIALLGDIDAVPADRRSHRRGAARRRRRPAAHRDVDRGRDRRRRSRPATGRPGHR